VIFVTQDLDQLAHFCLTLIDKTYQSHKLDAVGASGKFRVDIYEGAAKGQRPPKTQFIRSTYDSYSEKVWVYYKSATKSNTDDVGDESRADKRASIWRSPYILFALIAPFVAFPLGLWHLGGLFSSGFGTVKEPESEQAVSVVNPEPQSGLVATETVIVTQAPAKAAEPPESNRWRVGGHIKRRDRSTGKMVDVAVLIDGQFTTYVPLSRCETVSVGLEYRCKFQGEWVTPWSGPRFVGVTESVLASVPFAGGERGESTGETVQHGVTNRLVNPPPDSF
jgi:zona occludens toxin